MVGSSNNSIMNMDGMDGPIAPTITSREIVLAIIPHITGGLSVVGSSIIAGRVLRSKRKRQKTYHRLLCALSIFDLISSLSYSMSTWPIPADSGPNDEWNSPYHYGAIGNQATCVAQGFGIQLGITAAFYNVMLSIHYILTIKYNMPEYKLRQHVEPYMLSIPIVFGLVLTIVPLVLNLYNNSKTWCWIGPNFESCAQDGLSPQQCSQDVYKWRWIFYYGPCWFCLFVITCLQIWLVVTVYQTEQRTQKYTNPTFNTTNKNFIVTTPKTTSSLSQTKHTSSTLSPSPSRDADDNNDLSSNNLNQLQQQSQEETVVTPPSKNEEDIGRKKRRDKRSSTMKNASALFQSIHRSVHRRSRSKSGAEVETKQKQKQRSLTKEVALQATLYVGIFYITWIPKTLTSITTGMKAWVTPNNNGFYLLLIIVIVTPIQGFMNLFVHIRQTTFKFLQNMWRTCWTKICHFLQNCCSSLSVRWTSPRSNDKETKREHDNNDNIDDDDDDVDETHRSPHFTDVEEQQQPPQHVVAAAATADDEDKDDHQRTTNNDNHDESFFENEPNPNPTTSPSATINEEEKVNLLMMYELDD